MARTTSSKQIVAEVDQGIPIHKVCLIPKNPLRVDVGAAGSALYEFDVVSGCRCNCVDVAGTPLKLQYTPDGGSIVLLTRERTMYCWSTATWRRRLLLPPEGRYAGKELTLAAMAVSGGQQPLVYYTPLGKNSVRSVHTAAPEGAAKGAKLDREYMPGYKLKTENKKPIVGLAVHPFDARTIFVLLADATLLFCTVAAGAMTLFYSLTIPVITAGAGAASGGAGGGAEAGFEGSLRALPHPLAYGGALIVVEGAAGLSLVDLGPGREPRVVASQGLGPGVVLCGSGLVAHTPLLVALGRHPSGNVQVQAWRIMGDRRGLSLLPTLTSPTTVWDAFQGTGTGANGSAKPGLAAVTGDWVVVEGSIHPGTGDVALVTGHRALARAGPDSRGMRVSPMVPLLQLVDGRDVAGAAACVPLHTGLGFWTARDSDNTVSKLRFPRYAHLVSDGKLAMYDLTHGLVSDYLTIPPETPSGAERRMRRVVHSTKQGAWLVFAEVLSGPPQESQAPPLPGQFEFSLVLDQEAASTDRWFMPGASGAFVGGRDELVAVLSNSGRAVAVFETGKLQAGAKPLYTSDLLEGPATTLYQGPPSFLPAPPEPADDAEDSAAAAQNGDNDGEEGRAGGDDEGGDEEREARRRERAQREQKRLELPRRLLVLGADNRLYLTNVPRTSSGGGGGGYGVGGGGVSSQPGKGLAARQTLQLRPGEALVQVAWQALSEPAGGYHTANCPPPAAACVAALLTTERCLLVDERLRVVAASSLAPDLGLPVSCLWVGPALLVSTAGHQVLQVCWDGKAVHLCSLLAGSSPAVLAGALADRLLLASRPGGGARGEVAGRALAVLQPMVLGWATLAARRVLPGGAARARRELRALVGSYDACQLSVGVLEALAQAGFADVAAAVAARSDSPSVTPAHKAALAAAAGDWDPLVSAVIGEWERYPHHPTPPPRGSPLHSKLVALARACQAHGRFVLARRLLEGAGAWNELLALCVFQADFMGLQHYARLGGRDVQRLAEQLLAVNEDAFRHSQGGLYGGRPNTEDWRVEAKGSAGAEEGADADVEDIEVAPAGRLPFMEASLQVTNIALSQPPPSAPPPAARQSAPERPASAGASSGPPTPPAHEDEGMPIKALDLGTLEAYLGVVGASVVRAAGGALSAAAAGVASPATPTGLGGEAGAGFAMGPAGIAPGAAAEGDIAHRSASGWGDSEAGEGSMHGSASAGALAGGAPAREGETAAQAAARAEFKRETADEEDDFFSSDEDDIARHDFDTRSQTSMSTNTTSTQQRFKITIRSPDQPFGGDASALKAAAQALKLGSPLASPLGSARFGSPALQRFASNASDTSAAGPPGASPLRGTSTRLQFPALAPPPGSAAAPPAGAQQAQAPSTAAGGAAPGFGAFADDPFADVLGMLGPPKGATATAATTTAAATSAAVPFDPFFDFGGSSAPSPGPAAGVGAGALLPSGASTPSPSKTTPQGLPKPRSFGSLGSGQPMRQPSPPPAPASDLLSGWEDFESMFAGAGGGAPGGGGAAASPLPRTTTAPIVAPAGPAAAAGVHKSASYPVPSAAPAGMLRGGQAVVPGLPAFQAGDWAAAASTLGAAVKAGGTAAAKCMPYYVVARLLAAAAKASAPAAAKLARFAVALPLEDSHRPALVSAAVEYNMGAQNFGYAAEQLTWLILQSTSSRGAGASGALSSQDLQEKLNACDRAGGKDANLAKDEDLATFRALVGSCTSQDDADDLVEALIRG
ncbi:hypothetical protein N2152v2_003960 [Parachlorella kessleri]